LVQPPSSSFLKIESGSHSFEEIKEQTRSNTMGAHDQVVELRERMGRSIIGQEHIIERLILGLLCNGNLLVEGLPGLAKTRAVKSLAKALESDFSRIQFTPDLLPSDVTGTEVLHSAGGEQTFRFEPGPIFANIVLGDEINRAPAKVQSALLEAMEERQVTVAGTTHKLPPQRADSGTEPPAPIPQQAVFDARAEIDTVLSAEAIDKYIVDLVFATRYPERYSEELRKWIQVGASPRGAIGLDKASRAHAWLEGRDHVTPDDVRAVVHDVFRHRLMLSFEANAEGISANQVIDQIVKQVAVA
jgi:MoxR-like ATPase